MGGIRTSEAATCYLLEENNVSFEDGFNELMNAVVETAAEDLLKAMVAEQPGVKFSKVVILKTPTMGECNDIPTYANTGKIMPGRKFVFPDYYKEDILKKFARFKEVNPYDN